MSSRFNFLNMKNLYFNYIILSLIFTGFFYSCTMEGYDEEVLYINAKVENASRYNNIVEVRIIMYNSNIDKDVELARGEWKDGGFTISLPKTVDKNYLHALINNNKEYMTISDPPSTLSISDQNTKVWHAILWGVDKYGNMITRFYPLEIDEDGNGQDAFFTYVDSDLTISGFTERENATFAFTEYDNARYRGVDLMLASWDKITTTYSVNWKKGWNVWSFSRFSNMSEKTATEKWASTSGNILKWYADEDLWIGNRNP